jgi:protein-tyrosine phosphatase
MTREAIFAGYIPVIAHVERYECLSDISRIEDLQELGALIQVNADSVLGIDGRHFKRYTKKLLKAGLVDVIASDSHGTKERVCNMKKCYEYVAKKFGDDYAQEIMQTTPENIINGR